MTYWQPRGLPVTHNEGLIVLEEPQRTEAAELLQILDELALGYTHKTLK